MKTARQFLIAISFANICFLRIWQKVTGSWILYYSGNNPSDLIFASLALAILFALVVFFTLRIVESRSTAEWFLKLVLSLAFALLVIPTYIRPIAMRLGVSDAKAALGITVAILVFFLWARKSASKAFAATMLVISPFVLFTFTQAITTGLRANNSEWRTSSSTAPKSSVQRRVIWVVLDELDQGIAFERRPNTLRLPNMDRLKAESFFATDAYPPASRTDKSLPSLLTGDLVKDISPISASDLSIQFRGRKDWFSLSKSSTVFDDVADYRSAVVGWDHPYCRLFSSRLAFCRSTPQEDWLASDRPAGIIRNIPLVADRVLKHALRRYYQTPSADATSKIAAYATLNGALDNVLSRDDVALTLVHLPVPHPPAIFDRQTGKITSVGGSYLDNVALADIWLGELILKLKRNGTWDSTVLILTSDHWWRGEYWKTTGKWTKEENQALREPVDHRVPFIVRIPGQAIERDYSGEFNTVITRRLIAELVFGRIRTNDELGAWLKVNSKIGELPDYDRVW